MTLTRLLSQHLDDLRRSGLTDETIRRWGAYSVETDQKGVLNQLGFPHIDPPALVLPVLPPDRDKPNNDVVIKPDVAYRSNGKAARYLTRKHAPNRIHAPLSMRDKLRDVSVPLIITEGKKKAEKAAQEGICAVALAGVWNWLSKVGEDSFPIGDFDLIPIDGRTVLLVFDSDAAANDKVRHAEASLAAFLAKRGARVAIKRLPSGPNGAKCGLDDYLLVHTVADFWKLQDVEPSAPHAIDAEIVLECFNDITAKPVEWDWDQRIPRAKLTIFSGDPDLGKSTVSQDIVARFTKKLPWPDDASNDAEPGDVLMLIAEDDPEDTVKPRLMAAGADLKRVHLLKCVRVTQNAKKLERMLALDTDLALLEAHLKANPQVKLVVIDPITNYFGRANSNRDQELRTVLVPIKELADRASVTFIGVGHFNKRTDVSALHRVGGAVAMSGVARAVWMFMKDPDVEGQYLMLLGKGNLTKKRTGLRYRIAEKMVTLPDGKETGVPVIDWQKGESTANADDIVARVNDPMERKTAKAKRFLMDTLAAGDKSSDEIFAKGKENGLSRSAIFGAKKVLDISVYQQGRQWWWKPPVPEQPKPEREPGEEG